MRARLLALVAGRPGMSIRELAQALGVRRTAVVHHLRKLGAAGKVRCVRSGRRLLAFPAAATPYEGLVGLLRLETVAALVAALRQDPSLSVRGLARRLDVTPRAVRYHLLRLESLGLLRLGWGPGRRVLLLDEAAAAGALRDRPGPPPAEPAALPAAPLLVLRPGE